MFNNFINGTLNAKMHWQLLKMLLLISNTISLFIYGFMHVLFFDFPFEAVNEMVILLKLFCSASIFAAAISLLILLCDYLEYIVRSKKQVAIPAYVKGISIAFLAIVIMLNSCNAPVVAGVKKDFNTGLSSSYTAMEPGEVYLVMNNEVLNHTDIPLGESFLLVNDKIKGFNVKAGKVTVGCSLEIADSSGKLLLNEADLFAGHDQFNEKEVAMLRCTVNTGEPMKWEEKYKVKVTFWDKNGTGKIENTVTIRCIDMP